MSPDNGQQPLFYEDAYDAIEKAIAASGKTKKELAGVLYPGRQLETAKSLFTRALTPENTDVHLSLEMLLTILKETRPEDFIYFICDEFGFERPARKDRRSFERDMKERARGIENQIQLLLREIRNLEKAK